MIRSDSISTLKEQARLCGRAPWMLVSVQMLACGSCTHVSCVQGIDTLLPERRPDIH